MNEKAIRHSRAGFGYNDTLLSKFKFTGTPTIWEIDRVEKHRHDEITEYWTIKDENGASMVCFDKKLVESLHVSGRYAVKGDIKITKGGVFLALKDAEPLNGNNFTEK